MSVVNHECVIATTWNDDHIIAVQTWIRTLNEYHQKLFVITPGLVNGKATVFLAPDGSNKGWDTADEIKRLRDDFVSFLKTFDYDDGSNAFSWVEVGYGEYGQAVLRGNNTNKYNDDPYAIDK